MPQQKIQQEAPYTTSRTSIIYRTVQGGPLSHDHVDANFEILRDTINGLIDDDATNKTSADSAQLALQASIQQNYTDLSSEIDSLNTSLSSDIATLDSTLTTTINTLSGDLNTQITSLTNSTNASIETLTGDISTGLTQLIPAGTVVTFAGSSAPSGWLLCRGQSVSASTYSALYSAIGNIYGGNSTSFNLPDLRGRVAAGADNMGGTAAGMLSGYTVGTKGGSQSVTLTEAQIPSHDHQWFGENDDADSSGGGGGYGGKRSNVGVRNPSNVPFGKVTYVTPTGGGQSHPNVQPTLALNYIIKT